MIQYIPYLAGIVTLLFGLGFYLAIKDSGKVD